MLPLLVGSSLAARPADQGNAAFLPLVLTARGATTSTNLDASAATHLGGAQADSGSAVAIASDGSVLFGGTMPSYEPPVASVQEPDETAGIVMRFDRTGRSLLGATRIRGTVNDLEVSQNDLIVVCGDFGVAGLRLTETALSQIWSGGVGAGKRCSVGSDDTAAVLVGSEVVVFNDQNGLNSRWKIGSGTANDIAVDDAQKQVFVTGFVQISRNLQIPFIRAFNYDGTPRWKSYDFAAGTPNLGSADTRGERIAIGGDGKLYFAASINGGTGVSIFTRDPKDTSKSASDRTVVTDKYTNPFNVGSVKMLWFARFDPTNGELELAQSLVTRRSDDKGNSIGAASITADIDGTVYLAGSAAAFIANRDNIRVAGIAPGDYSGSDAYVLIVSPDFTQRYTWVTFTGAGGNGVANAVAVRNRHAALAGTVNSGRFISHNAIQPQPGGDKEAYLAVWR
jgi:hypothetical protein